MQLLPEVILLVTLVYVGFATVALSKTAKPDPTRSRLRNRDPDNASRPDVTSRQDVADEAEESDYQQHPVVNDIASRRPPIPDEQRLMRNLLANYDVASRPVYNASHTVVVKFGLTLAQIADMDEVNQVLTTIVWFEQEWEDERLKWNPEEYNNLSVIRIPCQRIWLPDIVLYNSADDFLPGLMQSKAMVSHQGTVFWPPPAKLRSSCKIDITYFPFDDQKCRMKFGSWTYDGFQVDVQNRSADVDLANYIFSGEWQLLAITVRRNEVFYACCHEPYPDVTFTIVIRRRTLYYLFNIIFPCVWLTVLSLLGFWLPPDSGEKITLGITVLLAFSVFMLMIAENMPATSEFVPLMGIYLTITMGMTSLSIILTVFVLQLYYVTPQQRPVPRWLRHFTFDWVARALRMRGEVDGYQVAAAVEIFDSTCDTTGSSPQPRTPADDRKVFVQTAASSSYREDDEIRGANGLSASDADQFIVGTRRYSHRGLASTGAVDARRFWSSESSRNRRLSSDECAGGGERTHGSTVGLLRIVVAKSGVTTDDDNELVISEAELRKMVANEWKLVALIMDRLLFVLFLIISTLSTFAILVVQPLTKPSIIE